MTKTNHSQCDYLEGYSDGRQAGAMRERERIITLLQRDICPDWATQIFYCCDGACSAYSDAIALIREAQDD